MTSESDDDELLLILDELMSRTRGFDKAPIYAALHHTLHVVMSFITSANESLRHTTMHPLVHHTEAAAGNSIKVLEKK